MYRALVFAFGLAVVGCGELFFPLRTDAPPAEWNGDEINEGLRPYNSNKGIVHVFAWEATKEVKGGKSGSQRAQALVLKRFDEPTKEGGHQWILVRLFYDSDDQKWRQRELWLWPPPPLPDRCCTITDAVLFGHELYMDRPTDQQVKAFLNESGWLSFLDSRCKLTAGGIDRTL